MKYFQGKNLILLLTISLLVLVVLGIFVPTDILIEPKITPAEILNQKPYITIFNDVVIIVPSSTLFVYLLGIQIVYLGYLFIKKELPLWGISLFLWGLGTILAGTSYQGLGYYLKCQNLDYCMFTSWFELAYLFVTAMSISVMGLAFSKMFITSSRKKLLEGYSKIAIIIYTLLLVLGSIIQNRVMISYEIFTVFFMPLFLVFFIINIKNYLNKKDNLNKSFIILWILFLIVNIAYYAYYIPGFTDSLYTNTGIWFSANDVLHIGLIIWFGYFQFKTFKIMQNNTIKVV